MPILAKASNYKGFDGDEGIYKIGVLRKSRKIADKCFFYPFMWTKCAKSIGGG